MKQEKEKKEWERKEKEEKKRKNPTIKDVCREIRDENRYLWNLRRMNEIEKLKRKKKKRK